MPAPDGALARCLVTHLCATCGACDSADALYVCPDCISVAFCSPQCYKGHKSTGVCSLLSMQRRWAGEGHSIMPASYAMGARNIPTEMAGADESKADASIAIVSASLRVNKQAMTAGQAIAAEYAQCAQTHPHLQRVAQVILPPCGERHPDSPAVVAAHEMLVCAAGLLDDKDWEEIIKVCDGL